MTPEQQQRIAIAEACGRDVKICPSHRSISCCGRPTIPDYLNDLNAIHEAVKSLSRYDRNRYINILFVITCEDEMDDVDADFAWCNATAPQRAEAFLRTIGKWVES